MSDIDENAVNNIVREFLEELLLDLELECLDNQAGGKDLKVNISLSRYGSDYSFDNKTNTFKRINRKIAILTAEDKITIS